MNPLKVVREFLEHCDQGPQTPEHLAAHFLKSIEPLGFRYFACCSHVNPAQPPADTVMLHNYPQGWVRAFSEAGLYEIDPVLRRAASNRLPFFWDTAFASERLTRPQRGVLREAAQYGLAHGYTIPLHSSWAPGCLRASCSVVPDSQSVDPVSYVIVEVLAKYLYLFASLGHEHWFIEPRIELSVRERECLELVAQGKTDWETARILGLSQSTAHSHIECAKRKLGVGTRQQAATYALITGQITGRNICRDAEARAGTAGATRRLVSGSSKRALLDC